MSFWTKVALGVFAVIFLLKGGAGALVGGARFIVPALLIGGVFWGAKKYLLPAKSSDEAILICSRCGKEYQNRHVCLDDSKS